MGNLQNAGLGASNQMGGGLMDMYQQSNAAALNQLLQQRAMYQQYVEPTYLSTDLLLIEEL